MKKYSVTSRPVKVRLFITYFLIFTIPLLFMGGLSYRWLSSIIRSQTESSYHNAFKSIKSTVDRQFDTLRRYFIELTSTRWVTYLMRKDVDVNSIDHFIMTDYNNQLVLFASTRYFYYDVALYFHEKELVLSSLGKSNFDYFFTDDFKIKGMSLDDWGTILNRYNYNTFLYPEDLHIHGTKKDGIIYLQSFPFRDGLDPRVTFAAYIDRGDIEALAKSMFEDRSTSVYIVDSDWNMVAASNAVPENLPLFKSMRLDETAGTGFKKTSVNGEDSYILYERSDINGWQYILIVPQASILKEVKKIQFIIFLILSISIVMGFVLSYILASMNYKPLNNILHMIREKADFNSQNGKLNEYEWLTTSINAILEQEEKLKERIERDKPVLAGIYLLKLLDEGSNKEVILKLLSLLDVVFTYPEFACGVVLALNEEDYYNEDYYIKILWKIKECAGKQNIAVRYTEFGNYRIVIFNYQNNDQLMRFIKDIKSSLYSEYGRVSIGIGRPCKEPGRICVSYKEALTALDYRLIRSKGSVTLFNEVVQRRSHYFYPIEKENCIANCLRAGDFESTSRLFNEIFEYNMKYENLSVNIMKYFFISAELTALRVAEEFDLKDVVNIGSLNEIDNINSMKFHVEQVYKDLCYAVTDIVNDEKDMMNEKMKDEVLKYIEERFSDPDLSLSIVSEKFGLSPSYFSRFFKVQFGCNFLDYINRSRIEHAKELLKNSQHDINVIVETVGYNNVVTFRRLFKKYEGVSPSHYREHLCRRT